MVDIHTLIMARLGLEDEAKAYLLQAAAEAKLRAYLNNFDESLAKYADAIVEIAVIMHQESAAMAAVKPEGALKAESFMEGAVSVRNEYSTVSDIQEFYSKRYDNIFSNLKNQRRGRILRRAKNA